MALEAATTRNVVVEEVLPHAPEVVWMALATSGLIAQWLMPNDFEPVVGKRFTLRGRPMGNWGGVVHCEVLEVVPARRLVYSWRGGASGNTKYGAALDTGVTWTLTPVSQGTRLRLPHAGLRSPENNFSFDASGSGMERRLA